MGPEHKYFTQTEAEAKVGKVVKSLVEFASVPPGTLADVISADPAGQTKPVFSHAAEVYDVAIQWRLFLPPPVADLVVTGVGDAYVEIRSHKPLVDWFTKEEYEQYLEEVEAQEAHPPGVSSSQ